MKLKIYLNQSNQIILQENITQEILNNYEININEENFTELFETELLNDIFDENNINSSEVYYELN